MKESSGEGDASKSHQVAATGFDSGDASQQQQQPAPTIQQIRPVGAAIGAAARSVPNGPSSSLPPSQVNPSTIFNPPLLRFGFLCELADSIHALPALHGEAHGGPSASGENCAGLGL